MAHLKDYQKMGGPFQGIDDGLGGKFLPSLPPRTPATSQDRAGVTRKLSSKAKHLPWDPLSGLAEDWAKLGLSSSVPVALWCSPTSPLEAAGLASPSPSSPAQTLRTSSRLELSALMLAEG